MAIRTIGAGGDYTTIEAWANYVKALGTLTEDEEGRLIDDAVYDRGSDLEVINFSSSLKNGFEVYLKGFGNGVYNYLTDTGARIEGSYAWTYALSNCSAELEDLAVKNINANGYGILFASGTGAKRCYFESWRDALRVSASGSFESCLIKGFLNSFNNGTSFYNCTFIYNPASPVTYAFTTNSFTGTMYNCVTYGYPTNAFVGTYNGTYSNNAGEDASILGTIGVTLSGDPFVDSANGDYTPTQGGELDGAGTSASGVTLDLVSNTFNTPPSIGALESVAVQANPYGTTITAPNTVPSTLTGFVSVITEADLPTAMIDGGATSILNGGGDLRAYTDSSKTTQLPLDVVTFITGGTPSVEVHVRRDMSSSATIYLEKDLNATAQPPVSDQFGRNSVWVDYEAVYHLNGQGTDSTGNHDATVNGSPATSASNFGADSYDFDRTDDQLVTPLSLDAAISGATGLTISAWCDADTVGADRNIIDAFGSNRSFKLWIDAGGSNVGYAFALGNGSSSSVIGTNDATYQVGWQHVVARYDGSSTSIVTDAGAATTGSLTGSIATNTNNFDIGSQSNESSWFDGNIKLLKIRLSAISDDWNTTEHDNQSTSGWFSNDGWNQQSGGLTRIQSDAALTWSVLERVNSDKTLAWSLLNRVDSDLTVSWSILNRVLSDFDLSWNSLERVASEGSLSWSILNRINSDSDISWSVLERLSVDSNISWSLLERITADRDLVWNINLALSRISNDLALRWSLEERVFNSLIVSWSSLERVLSDKTLAWSILNRVSNDLFASYSIQNRVINDLDIEWSVIQRAGTSLTIRYNIGVVDITLPETRTFIVDLESRTFTVEAESRTFKA